MPAARSAASAAVAQSGRVRGHAASEAPGVPGSLVPLIVEQLRAPIGTEVLFGIADKDGQQRSGASWWEWRRIVVRRYDPGHDSPISRKMVENLDEPRVSRHVACERRTPSGRWFRVSLESGRQHRTAPARPGSRMALRIAGVGQALGREFRCHAPARWNAHGSSGDRGGDTEGPCTNDPEFQRDQPTDGCWKPSAPSVTLVVLFGSWQHEGSLRWCGRTQRAPASSRTSKTAGTCRRGTSGSTEAPRMTELRVRSAGGASNLARSTRPGGTHGRTHAPVRPQNARSRTMSAVSARP